MSYASSQALREHDTVCRYGGEEFALLLPQATLDQAEKTADRLRNLVSAHEMEIQGRIITFTISLGVTPFRVGAETIEDALKRADMALYDAKAQGWNQIVMRDGQ